MKNKLIILAVIMVLIFGLAYSYLSPRLPIVTGYGAKYLCSSLFVDGRDMQSVLDVDLNFGFFKYASYKVDTTEKIVTSKIFGVAKQQAIYLGGIGCVLMQGLSVDSLKKLDSSCEVCARQTEESQRWPVCAKGKDLPMIDEDKLNRAIDSAFDEPGENTRAVIVIYDTLLIAEKYGEGFDRDTRILGWSMSKSVTNALVGVLVNQDKININDPVNIDEWQPDDRRDITLNNLMQMSSGLAWDEDYGNPSNVTNMLYREPDMYTYSIQVKAGANPGEKWYYSSGSANIVAGYLKQYFETQQGYTCFPKKQFFNLIGMNSAVFETDCAGTFVGSSYVHATPLDWARFGLLYLKDGVWRNNRILPEGWSEYTATSAKASKGEYGSLFWLNQGGKYPDAPADLYYANGHHDQRVFIIPSKNMVIVRMGFNEETKFDFNTFLKEVLAAVE